ncbi:MAG: peptidylprolyl isomerase [Bacteroidales bacterium]
MVRLKILLALFFITTVYSGLQSQDILMTIGDKEITLDEFERIYNKNNNNISMNRQTPEEYLDLFINFKLKVIEAENLGMDTTAKFLNEFNSYKDQLAKPYMSDEETKETLIREAYGRMKWDVHVSHILLGLGNQPSPEDTLARYEKAMEIRQRILDGEDFATVAKATSEDPGARINGGDLGYFTVFMMLYPFETAAYRLKDGEVSMPVRTHHGYHIIKKHGKRPAIGQVKVAHIFIRTPEDMSAEDQVQAKSLADAIADSLQMGVNFGSLAERYSDDKNSSVNGGELPWFGTGRMIKEFELAAFGLKNPGDFTQNPVRSYYGWHIIQLIDKQGIGTFDEMESTLRTNALKGDRDRVKRKKYLDTLKEKYKFSLDKRLYKTLYTLADTSIFDGKWKAGRNTQNYNQVLFSTTKGKTTLGDFAYHLGKVQSRRSKMPVENYIDMEFNKYVEEYLLNVEMSSLPERYPEYKHILQEYHDGILLFELMDQKVWTKAVEDSAGLVKFFNERRSDYMWEERMEAIVVSCDSVVDLEKVRKKASRIASGRWNEDKVNRKFCENGVDHCITLETVRVEEGSNKHVDALNGSQGVGDVYNENGKFNFIITTGKVASMEKELDETRGQVTSDYQNYLEEIWMESLKEKYKVTVNRKLVTQISNEVE